MAKVHVATSIKDLTDEAITETPQSGPLGSGRKAGTPPPRLVELLRGAVNKSSQAAVSSGSGVSRLVIQRYLRGIGEPSYLTLQKFATYFGVTISYLRGDQDVSVGFSAEELVQAIQRATSLDELKRMVGVPPIP